MYKTLKLSILIRSFNIIFAFLENFYLGIQKGKSDRIRRLQDKKIKNQIK